MKQITFTKVNLAELIDVPVKEMSEGDVLVRTEFSTVSCGTERANITDSLGGSASRTSKVHFPHTLGYSTSGIVEKVGEAVTSLKVGDRVVMYWSTHSQYNVLPAHQVVKIEDDRISMQEAALSFIATFPMAAIRKTRLEMGESVLVMGQGLLGLLAVKLARLAGGCPIVAVDPVEERRALALQYGADYAFSPYEEGFAKKVRAVTGGGANVAIEVTGVGAGLDGALDCMKRFGRVALLGCTRFADFNIDYYQKVHCPGITMIGAHTMARPEEESYPGYFTHRDDILAVLRLCAMGRLHLSEMIMETHAPADCTAVYDRLIKDKNFPPVVQFDWRGVR
ncbi:MAG: zinc-binding alcohol dehydrogenase [Clostridia bacterium]|nr:zinc-binding alcohol dehydrogenase [Clostridia bacterium]MBQ7339109.1 zinc-binding alcohol dehydrogenase [Clostridia bacterium]